MKKCINRVKCCIFLAVMILCINMMMLVTYAAEYANLNRYNVVIVLDASNSMRYTDPEGLRYEAIRQFTDLLAESGNHLGGIVFSNHVEASQSLKAVSGKEDKKKVTDILASVMSTGVTAEMGYTNIGESLSAAVDMLASDGSGDLPSVIVFLSDGNSEMPTNEELTDSLDEKASAIQTAREKNISIYTVCLNANLDADVSEMEQISTATGGEFQEVGNADDLSKVFHTFYSMIYGTSAIPIMEDIFPKEGTLNTKFEVPGFGVEEVNVVINGVVSDTSVLQPNGKSAKVEKNSSDTYTLLKITDVMPGEWILRMEGNQGNRVKINIIYNSDLNIDVETEPDGKELAPEQALKVKATLNAGDVKATKNDQYNGYHATLHLMDAYGDEFKTEDMSVEDGHFETECQLEEGVYYLKVTMEGNSLTRESEEIGPLQITEKLKTDEPEIKNTPPEAVETPIRRTVYIWPFKESKLAINMAELAEDVQDDELVYKVMSSSFTEGTDYHLDGDTVILEHFSLSKGSFDIKATDSGGLSCNIELIVTVRNIGVMALIGLCIVALTILIAFGITLRIALTTPFGGTITVKTRVNDVYKTAEKNPRRGRCKLSSFGVDHIGGSIIYSKSYFQAINQRSEKCVELHTNVPVFCQGKMTDKIKIKSDSFDEVKILAKEDSKDILFIKFKSRMTDKGKTVRRNRSYGSSSARQRRIRIKNRR